MILIRTFRYISVILILENTEARFNQKHTKLKSNNNGTTMADKFLNKFYTQTALTTHKKTNDLDLQTLLNPLVNADNPIIQQMSNRLRNSLFFNRSSSKYSIELVTQLFANKNLLINGTDFRSNNKDQIKFRWNLNKSYLVNSKLSQEVKKNYSTYMTNRN